MATAPILDNSNNPDSPAKNIAKTGVLGAAGVGQMAILDKVLKPRMSFEGGFGKAKYLGVVGGVSALGDYLGVKVNNMIDKAKNPIQDNTGENKYLNKIAAAFDLNPANKGLLHKKMGIPQGQKIPLSDLKSEEAKAKKSGNTKLEREVLFAEHARKFKH